MTATPSRTFLRFLVATMCGLVLAAGCSGGDPEQRAREMAERMKNAIPNTEQVALQQKASEETVKQAQENLAKLDEYMGPVNGEIDSVTVNAIEAFQRSQSLKPDGLLTDRTTQALNGAAAGAQPKS